jgi:hypothetical protein
MSTAPLVWYAVHAVGMCAKQPQAVAAFMCVAYLAVAGYPFTAKCWLVLAPSSLHVICSSWQLSLACST